MKLEARRVIHLVPLLLLGAAALLFIPRLVLERGGGAGDSSSEPAYAGSESCRECHEKLYAKWSGSHHALAEQPFDPALHGGAFRTASGEERVVVQGSQRSVVRYRTGRHEVLTRGSDGEVSSFEPVRVIGVFPLWQPVISTSGGRFQATALAYDPARDEWFDSGLEEDWQPHEAYFWANRGTTWNHMCATCHTTDFRKNYDPETDTYDSSYLELGVGCEACHGPYLAHNREMREQGKESYEEEDETDNWDPSTFMELPATKSKLEQEAFAFELGFEPILDTCGSCHARRTDLTGTFRAGDNFLDHFRPQIPDHSEIYYPDGQVKDEDYEYVSFLSSRMYLVGVRCLHCHDAHSGKVKAQGNDLCLNCHKDKIDPVAHSFHEPGDVGGRCVGCHMPLTTYMQRHPRRDHGFTIPDPLLTKEHGIPNACNRCHSGQSVDWAIAHVERWYGERMDRATRERARIVARGRQGDASAVKGLLELAEEDSSPLWRAVAVGLLGPWAGERREVADFLIATLSNPSALMRATAARALEPYVALEPALVSLHPRYRRFAEAMTKLLEDPVRVVRLEAAWALRRIRRPEGSVSGGDPDAHYLVNSATAAGGDLMHYLRISSDQPSGRLQQGILHLDRGEKRVALTRIQEAALWNPTAPEFQRWLAIALTENGKPERALRAMEEAHELQPDNAVYALDLAKALAGVQRVEDAEAKLELACRLDPHLARAWYNLAQARWRLGKLGEALEAITRADDLEPENPEYLETRATLHHLLGEEGLAREYLERARRARERLAPGRS